STEKVFKVLIVGDPSVGKTSFVQRYVYNTFNRHYKGTVGVDFALKVLHWADSMTVKLQLWDIAGQEKFSWMTRVYYKDSDGYLILFDLSNKNTLTNAIKWKTDVDSLCTRSDGRKLPCILVANKCDIPDSEKQVTREELEEISNQYQFSGWMEASAKEGTMVNESLRSVVTFIFS
ncbi:Ras-related protein Rab-7L1, partial [Cryptotermes secundus]